MLFHVSPVHVVPRVPIVLLYLSPMCVALCAPVYGIQCVLNVYYYMGPQCLLLYDS